MRQRGSGDRPARSTRKVCVCTSDRLIRRYPRLPIIRHHGLCLRSASSLGLARRQGLGASPRSVSSLRGCSRSAVSRDRTTVSPPLHHGLTTLSPPVSPPLNHRVTTISPPFHHAFTTLSPRFHHRLANFCHPVTTRSPRFHRRLTTMSPPLSHCFATISPLFGDLLRLRWRLAILVRTPGTPTTRRRHGRPHWATHIEGQPPRGTDTAR